MTQLQPLTAEVFEGLCNRVNCIASAMATGRLKTIRWAVNEHLPQKFSEVFHPLSGVEVINEALEGYPYTRPHDRIPHGTRLCYFYAANLDQLPQADFVPRMKFAYEAIFAALKTDQPKSLAPDRVGVYYRHFLKHEPHLTCTTPEEFLSRVTPRLRQLQPALVHVAGDCKEVVLQLKAALSKQLPGTHCDSITYPRMSHDLDRGNPEHFQGVLREMVQLNTSGMAIFSNRAQSTFTDISRIFRTPLYVAEGSPDRETHDDWPILYQTLSAAVARPQTGERFSLLTTVSIFEETHSDRLQEWGLCLCKNHENSLIEKITVFTQTPGETQSWLNGYALKDVDIVHTNRCPRYNDLLKEANTRPDLKAIVANADIYFDDTLNLLTRDYLQMSDGKSKFVHLTRREVAENHDPSTNYFNLGWGAGDAWIFLPKISLFGQDIEIGTPYCDQVIAHLAAEAGLTVVNPCHSVNAWHVHGDTGRNYGWDTLPSEQVLEDKYGVSIPHFVPPTDIDGNLAKTTPHRWNLYRTPGNEVAT